MSGREMAGDRRIAGAKLAARWSTMRLSMLVSLRQRRGQD